MQNIITGKEASATSAQETLSDVLSIDVLWRDSKPATIARYKGILTAKSYALQQTSKLLFFGRKLSWCVVFISALHIYETVASISPGFVPGLRLPSVVYYSAALLFTVLIDTVAVFLLKASTTLAYSGARGNKAIWFFYGLTAFLNGSFIAANTPQMTESLRSFLLGAYGNMFIFLLPLSVPIAMWAIEDTVKTLEVAKLKLTVDTSTLHGMLQESTYNSTEELTQQEATNAENANNIFLCVNCGAALESRGKWLASTRWKYCEYCKNK